MDQQTSSILERLERRIAALERRIAALEAAPKSSAPCSMHADDYHDHCPECREGRLKGLTQPAAAASPESDAREPAPEEAVSEPAADKILRLGAANPAEIELLQLLMAVVHRIAPRGHIEVSPVCFSALTPDAVLYVTPSPHGGVRLICDPNGRRGR